MVYLACLSSAVDRINDYLVCCRQGFKSQFLAIVSMAAIYHFLSATVLLSPKYNSEKCLPLSFIYSPLLVVGCHLSRAIPGTSPKWSAVNKIEAIPCIALPHAFRYSKTCCKFIQNLRWSAYKYKHRYNLFHAVHFRIMYAMVNNDSFNPYSINNFLYFLLSCPLAVFKVQL